MKRQPQEWKVLPAEQGHPMPSLGCRLMKQIEIRLSNGKIRHKWICIMMGHRHVIDTLYQGLTVKPRSESEQLLLSIHH